MHITQRTSYDLITDAVKDVGDNLEKEDLQNSVTRINPSLYRN